MANDSELSKLQAVKELIFGQEIKDYDSEFKHLHKLIENNKDQHASDNSKQEKALQHLEKVITSRIDRLEADLLNKVTNLENKKTDRAKLGKLLIQIGEKLQDS